MPSTDQRPLQHGAAFEGGYRADGLHRTEIREATGRHPLAILTFRADLSPRRLPPVQTPVSVRWGRFPALETFNGYVSHLDKTSTTNRSIQVYCVGASQPLNAVNAQTWTSVSGSYIARTIAERHGLRAVVTKTPEILPVWTQSAQENDLQMLARLADRCGTLLWIDAATLYFADPRLLIRQTNPRWVDTFRTDSGGTGMLTEFNAVTGTDTPDLGTAATDFYGVDASGRFLRVSSDREYGLRQMTPPTNRLTATTPIGSLSEGLAQATAAATRTTWARARAIVSAASGVRVGQVIDLDGPTLDTDDTGRWFVTGSHNVLTNSGIDGTSLSTRIDLVRNQVDRHVVSGTASAEHTPPQVPAVLHKGRWESSVRGAVYV